MDFKPQQSFESVGLPNGHASPKLAFHELTGTIVAHTRQRAPETNLQRLSIRRANESRYHIVGDFPSSISISSFALDQTRPLLYFNTVLWTSTQGNASGNWNAVYRFSLESMHCELVVRRGELTLPEGYHTAWIAELISCDINGQSAFCIAGLGTKEKQIAYYLSELTISDRRLVPISKLEAVFA